jgi:hypothetical protein
MDDEQEQSYVNGERMAYLSMLRTCLRELGVNDPEAEKCRWAVERQETIMKLRDVCSDHGDNDWPDDLHLSDIIEKHLIRHLED